MTEELAEFLGIMVGDGNIYVSKNGNYRVIISGHLENDFSYLTSHVKGLVEKLFNKKPSFWRFGNKKSFALSFSSKEIVSFLIDLGLKVGKKSQTVEIPKVILGSDDLNIKSSFLRGLFDTDGSVVFKNKRKNYTIIDLTVSSEKLAYQVKELLKEFNITSSIAVIRRPKSFSKVNQYTLRIYASRNFDLWMKYIKFSNENHLSRIFVWKKLGFYPPHISFKERLLILSDNLDVPWATTALNRKVG